MALIYAATLTPTKLDLLSGWLPKQPWADGAGPVRQLGAYRFDDPAGEVGIEGFLLADGGTSVLHVPLTYRAAPLPGAEQYLVATTEHSVLGTRWVYDGCGDPVWAHALATAVLMGGSQVEEVLQDDAGNQTPRQPSATVSGNGVSCLPVPPFDAVTSSNEGPTTVIRAGGLALVVVRVVGAQVQAEQTLTGRWSGGGPAILAALR
jgi:hypothetical protein